MLMLPFEKTAPTCLQME